MVDLHRIEGEGSRFNDALGVVHPFVDAVSQLPNSFFKIFLDALHSNHPIWEEPKILNLLNQHDYSALKEFVIPANAHLREIDMIKQVIMRIVTGHSEPTDDEVTRGADEYQPAYSSLSFSHAPR